MGAHLSVASFFSPERLGYPPAKAQREKLLARIDALVASSPEAAHAAAAALPRRLPDRPGRRRRRSSSLRERSGSSSSSSGARSSARSPGRSSAPCASCPTGSSSTCARRSWPDGPRSRRSSAARARVRTARDGKSRAPILAETAIFVPALDGLSRVSLEAAAAGAAIASPPGVQEQPELAAAALARFAENEPLRKQLSEEARRGVAGKTFDDVGAELEELYESLGKRRRTPRPSATRLRTGTGSSPTSTCTRRGPPTARSRSKICSTTQRARASARSRSPTTTSSAARSRPWSSPAGAT